MPSSSTSSGAQSRESSPDIVRNGSGATGQEYVPPAKSVPLDHVQADPGEFDWDAINDEDIELVLIRVPQKLKLKHLEGLELKLTRGSNELCGTLERRRQKYDICSLKAPTKKRLIEAEEMKGLNLMLPRRNRESQLHLTSKVISDYYVVVGTSLEAEASVPAISMEPPPRHKYPPELLSHRFIPYGAQASSNSIGNIEASRYNMDVDDQPSTGSKLSKLKNNTLDQKDLTVSKKKRKKEPKGDIDDAPKAVKRAKKAS